MPGFRRMLAMALLCSVALAAASPASAVVLRRGKATPIGSAIVQVSVFDWRGVFLRGGWGFFVDEMARVVTCRSLLEGGFFMEVTNVNRETFTVGTIEAEDIEGNLVLLGLESVPSRFSFLQRAGAIPKEGDRVLIGGGKGCEPGAFMDGTVDAVRRVPFYGHIIKVDSPFAGLGSPVFTHRGELIGLVMVAPEGEGASWVVSVGRVSKLMTSEAPPEHQLQWSEHMSTSWEDTPPGSYLTGFVHYWNKEHAQALPYLQRAVGDSRFSEEAYFLLGCCNDAMENYPESVQAYSMALGLSPASQEAALRLAQALLEEGDLDRALDVGWQGVSVNTANPAAYETLARIYNARGEHQMALTAAMIGVRLDPASVRALREQGLALRELGRFGEAVRVLGRVVELDRNYAQAYWDLAIAHYRSGDISSARQVCGSLRAVDQRLYERLSREMVVK